MTDITVVVDCVDGNPGGYEVQQAEEGEEERGAVGNDLHIDDLEMTLICGFPAEGDVWRIAGRSLAFEN